MGYRWISKSGSLPHKEQMHFLRQVYQLNLKGAMKWIFYILCLYSFIFFKDRWWLNVLTNNVSERGG